MLRVCITELWPATKWTHWYKIDHRFRPNTDPLIIPPTPRHRDKKPMDIILMKTDLKTKICRRILSRSSSSRTKTSLEEGSRIRRLRTRIPTPLSSCKSWSKCKQVADKTWTFNSLSEETTTTNSKINKTKAIWQRVKPLLPNPTWRPSWAPTMPSRVNLTTLRIRRPRSPPQLLSKQRQEARPCLFLTNRNRTRLNLYNSL